MARDIIKRLILSEKSSRLGALNQYFLEVDREATKPQIRQAASTLSCSPRSLDQLAASSQILGTFLPEERASHPRRPLEGRNPLCPCSLCSPFSHSPPAGVCDYFSRYACAPLPPDPSGLSASETSGGSTHTSSQPDLP